jgi:hypothetical protein
MTRTTMLLLVALLAPAAARAQADSSRTDSTRTDSAKAGAARPDSGAADSTRPAKPAPKPAAASPSAAPRALAAGECPSASERNQGDALLRFASPSAHGPVAQAKPLLRDPTLRGRTTLAFEVDTLGRADSTTVRIVDGDPYLLPTARSSVARWRFRPAELGPGCRVRARTTATVTF